MKIESTRVLGLDVSKHNVTCHILERYPSGGLSRYWGKTRNQAAKKYPVFYSSPKGNKKSAFDFVAWVKENQPSLACLEPTGNHYSRLWAHILNELNVPILWIGHVELKRYREGKNLPGKGKNDAVDSLAMAAYPHDPEHHLEDGTLDLAKFLLHQPDNINQMREVCQQIEHLARVQSPIVNYTRQVLAWQFPEMAHSKSAGLFPWLAQKPERCTQRCWNYVEKRHKESIANELGIEISDYIQLHGKWMCDIQRMEGLLDARLKDLLAAPEFEPYNQIFDKFEFGLRVRARLLSRIYPFESFLLPNGRVWIEHEYREIKKAEREYKDGQTLVKTTPGDVKRTKKNRSRDSFKMRVGMGTVLEASGDSWVEKPGGSSICRQSLWQHVLTRVETGKIEMNPVNSELIDYCFKLKSQRDANGKPLLHGKHIQGKLMAKIANMLFKELVGVFT